MPNVNPYEVHMLGLQDIEPTTTPPTLYPVNTLLVGRCASGKTYTAEQMIAEIRRWVPGMEVWEIATFMQTQEDSLAALGGLMLEIDYREKEMIDRGQRTCRRPLSVVLVDPNYQDFLGAARLAVAARRGPKVNMVMLITAQTAKALAPDIHEYIQQKVYLPEQGWYVYE